MAALLAALVPMLCQVVAMAGRWRRRLARRRSQARREACRQPGFTSRSPLRLRLRSQPNFAQGRAAKLIVPAVPKDCHTGVAMRLGVAEPGLRLGPVEVHKYAG